MNLHLYLYLHLCMTMTRTGPFLRREAEGPESEPASALFCPEGRPQP